MLGAHQKGIDAAMTYLYEHAGYTRVHNPVTGRKDLQRLPGLVGIAYQVAWLTTKINVMSRDMGYPCVALSVTKEPQPSAGAPSLVVPAAAGVTS
jgi:hypothetical protein